jgi:SAM-dependent methyltransferase
MLQYRIEDVPAIRVRGELPRACAGCGSGGLRAIVVPGDPEPDREEFTYGHCPDCGTLTLIDRPIDIARYYPDNYYSFSLRETSYIRTQARRARNAMTLFDAGPLAALTERLASNRGLLSLRPLFNRKLGCVYNRSNSILDVGCGDGQKLYDLHELGFSNLTGIDPFMRSESISPTLKLRRAFLKDVRGRFEIVIFNHSFEHLPEPESELRTALAHLSAGGVAVVRIPLVGGLAWRKFGGEWAQLDAPRHFTLFSRRGFEALAARAGWRVRHMLYDSGPLQFAGSRLRQMGVNLHANPQDLTARFPPKELREFARSASALNRAGDGDQATFFLFPATDERRE